MTQAAVGFYREDATEWEKALYAFLAEKHRRSGSQRTVQGYSGMLRHFFGTTGKTPDHVTSTDAFGWAHGAGPSGKAPSNTTVGARIACLSSFYRFLRRNRRPATCAGESYGWCPSRRRGTRRRRASRLAAGC